MTCFPFVEPAAAAHGPEFRRVCAERSIDARAAGAPARPAGEDHVLDRIAKLLALAESPNEHEAQAAMSAAQRLMLKYNVEAVDRGTRAGYGFEQLGVGGVRNPVGHTKGNSQDQTRAVLPLLKQLTDRVELLRLRAVVRENHMGDASGALDEYLRSFALAPDGIHHLPERSLGHPERSRCMCRPGDE